MEIVLPAPVLRIRSAGLGAPAAVAAPTTLGEMRVSSRTAAI
jgi:hypothetical protein